MKKMFFVCCLLGLSALAFPETPALLKPTGQVVRIPGLSVDRMSSDIKSARNGILVQADPRQADSKWYAVPFDGSEPVVFAADATGVDFQPMDMAYDGRNGYYMSGMQADSTGTRWHAALAHFDAKGNFLALFKIQRADAPNIEFYPRKIAVFGNGSLLIAGTTVFHGAPIDRLDTAFYNAEGQLIKPLTLQGDLIPNPHMRLNEDSSALTVSDYAKLDADAKAKVNPKNVLAAEVGALSTSIDATQDGDIVMVRKGFYVLAPVAFLIRPDGGTTTIPIPEVPAAEVVSCRFAKGRLLVLYEELAHASPAPRETMKTIGLDGQAQDTYEIRDGKPEVLLANWDGGKRFTFITMVGDVRNPQAGFIQMAAP